MKPIWEIAGYNQDVKRKRQDRVSPDIPRCMYLYCASRFLPSTVLYISSQRSASTAE